MDIDGMKNCLVAGIKQTRTDSMGMAILKNNGIGAMVTEKTIRKARANHWMSDQQSLWRLQARTPSRGLKERCSLVTVVESRYGCLHGFLERLLLLLLLAGRNCSGMAMFNARGHCSCGMCSLGLAWPRNEFVSCIVAVAVAACSGLKVWERSGLVATRPVAGSVLFE